MRGVAREAFRLGAALAREPTVSPPPAPLGLLDPRHLAKATFVAARFGAELVETALRGAGADLAYKELDNKVSAFQLFEQAGSGLGRGEGTHGVSAAVESARGRHGPERAVWAIEGIGYELGERQRRAGRTSEGLLSAPLQGVPSGVGAVLHTGLGMSLAEAAVERLRTLPSLGGTLQAHIALCEASARPGFGPLVFEPLGLVARLLEPELVLRIASSLLCFDGAWSGFFWHGVGRGLYFLPANLPPLRSAPWKGLAMAETEPPDEGGRLGAAAGFAWAVTLVNLAEPKVVESFLSHKAANDALFDAVGSGVRSAATFWHAVTSGSRDLRAFSGHVAEPERRELWARVVRHPLEEVLLGPAEAYSGERLAELFRYR